MSTHSGSRRQIIGQADYRKLSKSQRRTIKRYEVEERAARASRLRRIFSDIENEVKEREQILTLEIAEHYTRFGLPHCGDPGGGGFRGKIREFSRAARRRLILDFGKLLNYPSCWITLTFADDVMMGKTVTERGIYGAECLKKFSEWLERRYRGTWALWRKEWEVRKYGILRGELCPHYHVMLEYGLDGGGSDRAMIHCLKRWVRITGTRHPDAMSVAMRPKSRAILNGIEMAQRYVSKYMSKTTQDVFQDLEEEESLGRYWGRIGEVPYGPVTVLEVGKLQMVRLRRMLHRLCKGKRAKEIKKKLRQGVGWVFAIRKTVVDLIAWIVSEVGEGGSNRHILAAGGNTPPF